MVTPKQKPVHDSTLGTDADKRYVKTVNYRRCPTHGKNIPIGESCPDCEAEARRKNRSGEP